jgi:hypothetical protein
VKKFKVKWKEPESPRFSQRGGNPFEALTAF